jgi:hypothetical protein
MAKRPDWRGADTFVVKVYRREGGTLSGLIEHLRTGQKQGFTDLEALSSLLLVMMRRSDGPATEPAP